MYYYVKKCFYFCRDYLLLTIYDICQLDLTGLYNVLKCGFVNLLIDFEMFYFIMRRLKNL